jgi:hypothetical protein
MKNGFAALLAFWAASAPTVQAELVQHLHATIAGSITGKMDEMWDEQVTKLRADTAERGQRFNDGKYAMFIQWRMYETMSLPSIVY